MNVAELKELLDEVNDEAEVRLAHQPSWPLQFHVRGIARSEDLVPQIPQWLTADDYDGPDDYNEACRQVEMAAEEMAVPADVVWIVEGGHPDDSPYAPGSVFDQDWR